MKYKYGLLESADLNLGNEIQSVIVRRLLPRVDLFLDGDYLNSITSNQKIRLITHGCFMNRTENWPPSPSIDPLFISFHIAEHARKTLTSGRALEYFKRYEPIGCRDYSTRDLLLERGVEAYFSGCITLTLDKVTSKRGNEIILTDLDRSAMKYIPLSLLSKSTLLSHGRGIPIEEVADLLYRVSPPLHKIVKGARVHFALNTLQQRLIRIGNREARRIRRFKEAEEILERYSKAKLVITSRLHAALPCVALGTPVIFVHRNLGSYRFSGLLDYVNHYSIEEFRDKIGEIELNTPRPDTKPIDELRRDLVQKCREFIGLESL